jgi:hypothetical protein
VQKRVFQDIVGKKRIEDVKSIPRVMSPIEELRYLSLVNFRRLDKDPLKAVRKIVDKIKLLEDERYAKKLEGIAAWRQSAVNKIYLTIGQESISQGKPVDVIINERTKSGKEVLTKEEFDAILRLNREIRF